MKKIFLILVLVLGVVTLVGAQENLSGDFSNNETANCVKYKFSINFGNSFSYENRLSPGSYSSSVQPVVPYIYGIDMDYNAASNMIGMEFRWMFKPLWSLNISGLGILKGNPTQDYIQGVYDSGAGGYIIPNINSVPFQTSFDWVAEVGVSHYFDLPNKKLLPYLGFSVIYNHGGYQFEYPLVIAGDDPQISASQMRGKSRAEFISWGFAVPMGFEYYLTEGLFLGGSIHAVNYFYSMTQIAPGEGMELARADQSTFSFFTLPMLKLGIAF